MSERRGSLVLRLVALGLIQVMVAVVAGDWLISRASSPPASMSIMPQLVADLVARDLDDPAALRATLERLRARDRMDVSIYGDADHLLVATNVDPPVDLRAVPPPHARPQPGAPHVAHLTAGGKAYTVASRPPHSGPRGLPPPVWNLIAGLAIVSVWAFLVGRWVVGPLRGLTRAVRAAGAGDLSARTRFVRRDEIGEVGRAFDEMAERLQELLRAEKELLANVSHELRTPLARIRVALDLAAEGDAALARASLEEIAVDLGELEAIIDDILTATRFDVAERAAGFALRLQRTTAEAIGRQAEARFTSRHPKRSLSLAISSDLPAIEADPGLFRRAIDNLLENAHKYTPDPDRAIDLVVAPAANGESISFEVRDRGIGIPAEDLPHVFSPFFRGDRSRTRGTGGVGLGLTLAKRIIEAHRGTISVASGQGGTTFRVEVPRVSPPS